MEQFLTTWAPLLAIILSGIITSVGWIVGYGRLITKVDQLEKVLTDQSTEHKEALEKVEQRTGLRMSTMEARQAKLEDIFLTKLDANDSKLNAIGNTVAEIRGFLTAQRENSDKRPRSRG